MSVVVEPVSGSVLTVTIDRYLAQIAVSLRPSSVVSATRVLLAGSPGSSPTTTRR